MLGLRLDEGLPLDEVNGVLDSRGVERMERLGLVELREGTIALTRRGRLLGTGVTVELLAEASEQDASPRAPARGRELVA